MKIQAGMMVEIVDHPDWNRKVTRNFIGHVGKVLRPCNIHANSWDIEGAEIEPITKKLMSWNADTLRPIPPDETASWDTIHKDIGWKPPVEVEA